MNKIVVPDPAQFAKHWIENVAEGLPCKDILHIFELATFAVWQRSLTPLSEVTLVAIFERVLHKTQSKYPLLLHIKLQSDGIKLNGLSEKANELNREELKSAFEFFFASLLTVLGNLTANILTPALYTELLKIEFNDEKDAGKRND